MHRLRLVILAGALLSGCTPADERIAVLELEDLQAPIMFEQVASGLRRPYVVEMHGPVNARFDLELHGSTLDEALDAIVELDPSFQHARRGRTLLLWPSGTAGESSVYTKEVAHFQAEGGVGEVLRLVLVEAGLAATTELAVDQLGLRRPVKLDVKGVTVRDLLADVAEQAQLALVVVPGRINAGAVPE